MSIGAGKWGGAAISAFARRRLYVDNAAMRLSVVFFALFFTACASNTDMPGTEDGGRPPRDASESEDAGVRADATLPDMARPPVDMAVPVDAAPDAPSCTARTCEEAGATCGTIEDGCGLVLDCGFCGGTEECVASSCACLADDAEPNNTDATAKYLGALTDSPDSSATYRNYMIASSTDEDWFRINVADDWDTGNPNITVSLTSIPGGHDYDLLGWFRCDTGADESVCANGSPDTGSAYAGRCVSESRGSVGEQVRIETECGGTIDETGKLYVRVKARTWLRMCLPYVLTVSVI